MPSPPSPRFVAAQVVQSVLHNGAYSHIALDQALKRNASMNRKNKNLTTQLVYGTIAWKRPIDLLISKYSHRTLRKIDDDVLCILRVATFQFIQLDRIPSHAILSEAIHCARALKKGKHIVNFINAVLRAMSRKVEELQHSDTPLPHLIHLEAQKSSKPQPKPAYQPRPLLPWTSPPRKKDLAKHLGVLWSWPDWMVQDLIRLVGKERTEEICKQSSQKPPLVVRTSPHKKHTLSLEQGRISPSAGYVEGFSKQLIQAIQGGQITVQDEAAQLVSYAVHPQENDTILEICAGLGGKTTHLLEILHKKPHTLISVEPQASKVEMLLEHCKRLQLSPPQTETMTLQEFAQRTPPSSKTFDRVLIDAPCSGLGTLSRHPEIRWSRTQQDVQELVETQKQLVHTACDFVRPGGRLIYSVCTWTYDEGPQQIKNLLEERTDFSVVPTHLWNSSVDWTKTEILPEGVRLLPDQQHTDGFFLSVLQRTSDVT